MPNQADIVLVHMPFTDLSSSAFERPVIVISNDAYQSSTADMVVVAMTSNLTSSPHSFVLNPVDLAAGTLNHPSRFRV